jgi:hypothetical protein
MNVNGLSESYYFMFHENMGQQNAYFEKSKQAQKTGMNISLSAG